MSDRYQALRVKVASLSRERNQKALPKGSHQALRQTQRLIEEQTRILPRDDRGPLACRAGCNFCCHLRVLCTAPEVFAVIDWMRAQASAEDFKQFRQRVAATAETLHGLDPDKVLRTNLACPNLVDGHCSVYAARPLSCRAYHSLSREACETSFNAPENLDLGHPQLTALAKVHEGGLAGLIGALDQAGLDSRQYELVTAMDEALRDPAARTRFENGERAFSTPLTDIQSSGSRAF
ncbi:MAG: YkgJ family cysteine cluster protein [Wenzhouxiangella sp.]|nr:MAG: YkgJ family cysteine cluster protein [Wenzhouxiangella sp.]